jgi:F0F1-type ATP synthase alpha subunit
MLESKGVKLTEDVLVKVGIPLPGSDHPVAGRGQRSAQHLEELTSLVDGHIDLRESLASAGRMPPIDPSNSLTRIGVGSSKLRPLSATPAMTAVCGPLRLELASAADFVHCEEAQRRRADAYMAVLQQEDPVPLTLGEQVALLAAAASGALDEPVSELGAEGATKLLEALRAHINDAESSMLKRISESGLLSEQASARLAELTSSYLAQHC